MSKVCKVITGFWRVNSRLARPECGCLKDDMLFVVFLLSFRYFSSFLPLFFFFPSAIFLHLHSFVSITIISYIYFTPHFQEWFPKTCLLIIDIPKSQEKIQRETLTAVWCHSKKYSAPFLEILLLFKTSVYFLLSLWGGTSLLVSFRAYLPPVNIRCFPANP